MGKTIPFIPFYDPFRDCVTISHSEKSQKEQLIPGVLFVKNNLAKHCPSRKNLSLNYFFAPITLINLQYILLHLIIMDNH